jgi:hypothetical protein
MSNLEMLGRQNHAIALSALAIQTRQSRHPSGALAGAAGQIEWRRVERADHGGKYGYVDPFAHLSAPLEGQTLSLMAGRNASERPEKRPLKFIIIDKSDC